jgi:hypothetical protein
MIFRKGTFSSCGVDEKLAEVGSKTREFEFPQEVLGRNYHILFFDTTLTT